jgi:hypothetical protein
MEENHHNRIYTVSPDGRWLIDDREVNSFIIFEEEAKNLLENELMEGPLNYYPEDEDDYPLNESEDLYPMINEDEDISIEDISIEGGYYDIINDVADFNI